MKVTEKLWLGRLATPLPDRHRPVYNWFPMKEAFSRDLIFLIAETWGLGHGDVVLDPFCGTGTTPLACKELELDCVAYDTHPAALFASRVKLRDYDVARLREAAEALLKGEFVAREAEAPPFVSRVFSKQVLGEIASARERIQAVDDEAVREFMLMGLSAAAMRCSWAHKDGAAIKVAKRPVPPLRKELGFQLRRMCADVDSFRAKGGQITLQRGDARRMAICDGIADAVITSPPYLEKREYIHAQRLEQWVIGLEAPSESELIGAASDGDYSQVAEFVEGKPAESRAYFRDMLMAIKEIHRACRGGANVCLVVSDGCSTEGPVDACLTISAMAEKAGFRTKSVVVANKRQCTTPSRKKLGIAREGLLFWSK